MSKYEWGGVESVGAYHERERLCPEGVRAREVAHVHYDIRATICVNWLTSQQRLVDQLTHSAASPRSSLSVYRRSQWTIGTPLAGRQHRPSGCLAALPSGGDEAIQASSPPDGSNGSTTSGHRRPAMAFLTHLETPQAAESLLAAAVRSHPSWERSRKRVEQSSGAFRRSKGGYQ